MTSGEFSSFPVTSVWVDRDKRQRRELRNISDLASSIQRLGLMHPPILERSGELRTGERRFEAIKLLGWTHLPVQFTDELDQAQLQLLELEENLQRENITWEEECRAVLAYHSIRLANDAGWTKVGTADAIGRSPQWVSDHLGVAQEQHKGNAKLSEVKKYSTARNVVSRMNERAAAADSAKVSDVLEAPRKQIPLLNGNFIEWVREYDGPKFNFIHCDFPYGVNAGSSEQQSQQPIVLGGYDDGFDIFVELLGTLGHAMALDTIVAPQAHLMFWFSMDYYAYTKDKLELMGWTVNPFPLIWHKSDNMGILPDPQRGPRRTYETAFFARRGDMKLTANGAVSNSFAHPGGDKSIHMSEKPVTMLNHFMRMIVDNTTRILDPTCGSGNSIKGALALGANAALGIELSTEFYDRAVLNLGE
jgi:ParB/RepB/Spo0J family partition protein